MDTKISRWWDAVRTRLTPLSSSEPLSVDALEARLRAAVAPYVAPDEPSARVVLPPPFREQVELVGATTWLGQRIALDFMLASAGSIAGRFDHALSLFGRPDEEEGGAGVQGAGVWLEFAQRGDRTVWFLCCDPTRAEYGQVLEGDDAHPWLNGVEWLAPTFTLAAWRERVRGSGARPRTGQLLALEEVSGALVTQAKGDARTLLMTIRALVDERTPDPAWQRTWVQPTWTLLLRDEVAATRMMAGADVLRDDRVMQAWWLDTARVATLASAALPPLRPWDALAWNEQRRELRAVEDATGCAREFVARAAAEGRGLLWVRDAGTEG